MRWSCIILCGALTAACQGNIFGLAAVRKSDRLRGLPVSQVHGDLSDVPGAFKPITKETDKFSKDLDESGKALPGKLEAEGSGLKATFLPGFEMSWVIFSSAMGTVVFAMIWFFVYLQWIYQDDRK